MSSNVETVRRIYTAFQGGDLPTILEALAEDVQWEYGPNSTHVPWLQPRRGRANVADFFEALGHLEIRRFEPTALLADGGIVVALIQAELVVRANGREIFEVDEVHVWHFDGEGRVSRFRHRVDTHQHVVAWQGVLVPGSIA